MRLSFQKRPAARRPHLFGTSLTVLAAVAPSLSQAFNFTSIPSPNLDLSNLGRVGIAGDFNGISLYEYEGQGVQQLSANGSEALWTELPNGALAQLAGSDGTIRTMCSLKLKDGTQGVILGGNFTRVDGIKSTAMALFNLNTTEFTPLDGLKGEVNAMFCDQGNGTVYVGGSFTGANSTNAIAWLLDGGWTNLPFAGFNGPVDAITKASNGHIIFGGSFTGLGNVSAPGEPDGQVINLSTAKITAAGTSLTNGFNDPENIVCPDGSDGPGKTWLLADGATGLWEANFGFGFEPTKLRLWNTHHDGRGTKTFRFIALPIDGIMNLTYVDPATGKNQSCTSECPLSNDPKVKFQDFHFVNTIGMNRFQVAISAFYGNGAGLAGIQLSEDNVFSYAVQDFNEPKCGINFPSTATATGPWSTLPSVQTDSSYLSAKVSAPFTSKSASVVFTPNIKQSGNYSINIYTPGCVPDGTCLTRGRVNITGIMSTGTIKSNFTTSLYQTNYYAKYDEIFVGYIERTSDSFKPSITVSPFEGQDLSELTLVAQKVGFNLINGTGGLNGLFDFDPSKAVIDTAKLDASPVNKLGTSFDHNSGVTTLATAGDVTYIGGNFSSTNYRNLVAINANSKVVALDGGLNGEVNSMYLQGNQLFIGGGFTNKQTNAKDGLNHVAVYDTKADSWSALGAGVDGTVEYVAPFQVNISNTLETAIAFTGSFSECKAFGSFKAIPTNGFAVWVLSKKNWLQNINAPVPSYTGSLTSCLLNVTGDSSLFAGSVSSSQIGANGAVTLTNKGLGRFPVNIQAQGPASGEKRRAVASEGTTLGVVTGAFYTEGNNNITILAGHFSAQSNGSAINNLLFIDGKNGDSLSGLGSGMSTGSVFTTLAFHGSVLFAGGNISGTIDGGDVNGIVAYDLASKSFTNAQPAPVSGGNSTVAAITIRPDTSDVYVGGSFTHAGALDCPGLCLYDADSTQWTRPGSSFAGSVNTLMWSSKTQLIAGGDLQANGSDTTFLAIYDTKKQTWKEFPGANNIPGPVSVLTPASGDNNQLWVSGNAPDGSIFIMKYDGKEWHSIQQLPPSGSVVQSLQVFTLTKPHGKTDLLADKQVLMLTGSIPLPNVGTFSAVIYNGTNYQPYALATGTHDGAGSIAKIFSQKGDFFTAAAKHLPLVFVVLIGLAISLALILLLVVSGIVLDRVRKKREGYSPAPTSMYDRGSGIQRIPPRELLESLGKSRPSAAPHI
ncbi:Squalestatin S1 biosynthesis cluster protein L1 [Cladobotryum mycophilum]|uniref:Squalestatin S1 biosynthesis cluster protein L1 n=1 Tax=Cladobotryum mycophilum TaxID=491253 RepID=A0ABR0SEE1_9HYPO